VTVHPRDRPTDKTAGMRFVLLALVVTLTACSSAADPGSRQLGEPTATVGRQVGDPGAGRVAFGPPPRDSRAVHVLGEFEQLPNDTTWSDSLPPFDTDVATIATVACEFGSDGCTTDLLGNLASAGVDVVNLEPAARLSSAESLVDAIAAAEQSGMAIAGRDDGAQTSQAVESGVGTVVAVHSIQIDSADISDVEQSLREDADRTDASIVLVSWGDVQGRSPSAQQVSIAEGLIDAGVRAIIGNGSVHLQRMERIGDGIVAYNLGHAFTNREEPLERDTAILRLVIDSPTESSCLLPATAEPEGPTLDNPLARWCG